MPNSRSIFAAWPSLEAQVAAIADDIAYDNHDIDDGLRAGLFTLDELLDVPLVARCWAGGAGAAIPTSTKRGSLPELVRDQIGLMVNDVLEETRRRIAGTAASTASRTCAPPAARWPASPTAWRPRSGS